MFFSKYGILPIVRQLSISKIVFSISWMIFAVISCVLSKRKEFYFFKNRRRVIGVIHYIFLSAVYMIQSFDTLAVVHSYLHKNQYEVWSLVVDNNREDLIVDIRYLVPREM